MIGFPVQFFFPGPQHAEGKAMESVECEAPL